MADGVGVTATLAETFYSQNHLFSSNLLSPGDLEFLGKKWTIWIIRQIVA